MDYFVDGIWKPNPDHAGYCIANSVFVAGPWDDYGCNCPTNKPHHLRHIDRAAVENLSGDGI